MEKSSRSMSGEWENYIVFLKKANHTFFIFLFFKRNSQVPYFLRRNRRPKKKLFSIIFSPSSAAYLNDGRARIFSPAFPSSVPSTAAASHVHEGALKALTAQETDRFPPFLPSFSRRQKSYFPRQR